MSGIQPVATYVNEMEETAKQIAAVAGKLPDALVSWKPAEDKWSVLEVLCHIEEATSYWLIEIKRLLESPGAEWGRGLQDPGRLAGVARAATRTREEALAGLLQNVEAAKALLLPLTEEQLSREAPSRNPRFGTKPLRFIVEHLLAEHLNTHLNQINRNIVQYH